MDKQISPNSSELGRTIRGGTKVCNSFVRLTQPSMKMSKLIITCWHVQLLFDLTVARELSYHTAVLLALADHYVRAAEIKNRPFKTNKIRQRPIWKVHLSSRLQRAWGSVREAAHYAADAKSAASLSQMLRYVDNAPCMGLHVQHSSQVSYRIIGCKRHATRRSA